MKHRHAHHAEQAYANVLGRVRRKGRKGFAVTLCDRDTFIACVSGLWPNTHACPSCSRTMGWLSPRQPDLGATPSVHKVIPARGYVPGNMRVVCTRCNTAIGDASTPNEIDTRIAALNWQRQQIQEV